MSDLVVYNGTPVAWQHLAWEVQVLAPDFTVRSAHRFFGFTDFDHGENQRDRPTLQGANPSGAPWALAPGRYEPAHPKVTMWTTSADNRRIVLYQSFMAALKEGASDGRSIGDVPLHMKLTVTAPGFEGVFQWLQAYLTNEGRPWAAGDESLKTTFGFKCLRYIANDTTLFDSSAGLFT